jgi:nucleoside-triphosphatase THEP1
MIGPDREALPLLPKTTPRKQTMRLFLTGTLGVGKTTLIRGVLKRLKEVSCAGFYTEEKRHKGQRIGFKIITLDGQEGTLASIGRKEPTVGRHSIHIAEFEELILPPAGLPNNPGGPLCHR